MLDMGRRQFITLVGGAAAASPLAARAAIEENTPCRRPMARGYAEEEAIYLEAFLEGLKGLGYIDGKTISLEHRFPNEIPERFVELG